MDYANPVEVEGLVARYGQHTVLDGVDVQVAAGEIRVILGGSGCGKSTLLRHMIGLLLPAGGTVRLLGTDLATADEPEREAVMARVGMLFQAGALLNSMTLADNVALPIAERTDLPRSVIDDMVKMKLALLGLADAADRMPKELSGGMQKRAGLARAMALDPEVLFCDEPSAGLDPVTAADLDRVILGLRDRFGMAIVVVTHELDSIRTIADRVTMLAKGHVIAEGTLDDVRDAPTPEVSDFFHRRGPAEDRRPKSVLDALREAHP